ncbi:MAG: ATP-binding protein [Candidatus Cybelea sp.]|jgi:anti-sigma regulatory factor (Ser/Thr protein kinase)
MSRTPQFSRRFPCSAAGAREARTLVAVFAANWLSGEDLIGFELGAGEALANCVEHGGGPILSVDCCTDGRRLVAEIRHQGRGFKPPECVNPPPQGAPRGYGLFIMHEVVDGVEFMDGGRGCGSSKTCPLERAAKA